MSQGVFQTHIFWGLIYPGTIVLTDNCTTAIRPAAKDALSGIFRSLADFGEVGESCSFYKFLQTPEKHGNLVSFIKSCRLRRGIKNLILF